MTLKVSARNGKNGHCLALLAREENLCVCELCHATDLSRPKISRHLGETTLQRVNTSLTNRLA
jgi:DNA-binding transcriptional ArsR family regulator